MGGWIFRFGVEWKEGKADGAADRQSPVGRVALRRFCPTLRVEAPTAVLGSWVSSGLQGSISGTDGSESPPALAQARRKARPNGFSGGSPVGKGCHRGLDDVILKQVTRGILTV
jgi:hypothetical protein